MTNIELNALSRIIVNAAYEVHKELGPGLLESTYQFALMKEFELQEVPARSSVTIQLLYKGFQTGRTYELDIIVADEIVLELKSVVTMHPVFDAQLISYLKITGKRLGFLINFNVPLIKNGIKRMVNGF